jgi:DNA-binding NtrC family response regulator
LEALTRVVLTAPDPATQSRVQMVLGEHGVLVAAAGDPASALDLLALEGPAALLVDVRQERERAFALEHARKPLPLIGLIDADDEATARALLSHGAGEVVPVPLIDALLMHRLTRVLASPTTRPTTSPRRRRGDLLIGTSEAMIAVARRIDMIAKSDIGAAIYGETGTGKELAARAIHAGSRRSTGPLVVANCTAIPETLFENELFGHERGAFTGADRRDEGLLASAEGGTLLLDEIGDIALSVQPKLLRLVQFREYKMVGGTKTLNADVRILTSTHRDLGAAVEAGTFRRDLYYRLNTLHIELPPLRERLEDIPLLVDHFRVAFNGREGGSCEGFTADAVRRLQRHDWPGNVRELESVVYRSMVMAVGKATLGIEDLDIHKIPTSAPSSAIDLSRPFGELKAEVLEQFERRYLEDLLGRNRGNLSQAAREARHERKSLWRLLSKYAIDPSRYRRGGGDG